MKIPTAASRVLLIASTALAAEDLAKQTSTGMSTSTSTSTSTTHTPTPIPGSDQPCPPGKELFGLKVEGGHGSPIENSNGPIGLSPFDETTANASAIGDAPVGITCVNQDNPYFFVQPFRFLDPSEIASGETTGPVVCHRDLANQHLYCRGTGPCGFYRLYADYYNHSNAAVGLWDGSQDCCSYYPGEYVNLTTVPACKRAVGS